MKKLWNDEYGFAVNKFLKGLAKILLVFCPLSFAAGFIVWGGMGFDEWVLPACLGGSVAFAIICFLGAVNLLWLATLGNNVAKIRQQGESDK
jgi:hypothetical protein